MTKILMVSHTLRVSGAPNSLLRQAKYFKEAGYEVKSESVQFSEGITGERIMASKGESFCSIVYGLDVEEAAVVFKDYEKEYSEDEYFVLAQNEQFVYCMSDKKAFDGAGFTKLGTSGVLFVNYGNK